MPRRRSDFEIGSLFVRHRYVRAAMSTVLKYGHPSKDNLKYRDGYVLAYDRRTRNPHWVGEHLTKSKLALRAAKRCGPCRRQPCSLCSPRPGRCLFGDADNRAATPPHTGAAFLPAWLQHRSLRRGPFGAAAVSATSASQRPMQALDGAAMARGRGLTRGGVWVQISRQAQRLSPLWVRPRPHVRGRRHEGLTALDGLHVLAHEHCTASRGRLQSRLLWVRSVHRHERTARLTPWRLLCAGARFEQFARDLTNNYDEVTVFSGPLYMPSREADGSWVVKYNMIGNPPNVAVPTHFFKVILGERRGAMALGSFILPNKCVRGRATRRLETYITYRDGS
jgi:hypothetical protein